MMRCIGEGETDEGPHVPDNLLNALQSRGVQPFGVSGPHWKKKSCLGPHIKCTNTNEDKKNLIF